VDFLRFFLHDISDKTYTHGEKMLREKLSQYFVSMQRNLFPCFADDLGLLTDRHLQLIVALDVIQVERFTSYQSLFAVGRPPINRDSLARAFVAKAILNIPTTVRLIDRIKADPTLRRLCGFNGKIPCEATFSNAFDEFAKLNLPGAIHEWLIYSRKSVGLLALWSKRR
jgi:hypothetical protein